jgi:hypothetical protein
VPRVDIAIAHYVSLLHTFSLIRCARVLRAAGSVRRRWLARELPLRNRILIVGALCALSTLVSPSIARADNTTSTGAYTILVGGTPAESTVAAGPPAVDRWYVTQVNVRRSYCAETQGGVSFDASATAGATDTTVTVYGSDATTQVALNADIGSADPPGGALSRACFVVPDGVGPVVYIKVSSAAGQFNVRTRIVETTLYSSWYYTAADYDAFTLLRNTTSVAVAYTIHWRDSNGVLIGANSGTLAPHGGAPKSARQLATASPWGTVEIVHNGSRGAIVASTTVLSATTGIALDVPFELRPTW